MTILSLHSSELHPYTGRFHSVLDIFLLFSIVILSFLHAIHLHALQWHARYFKVRENG